MQTRRSQGYVRFGLLCVALVFLGACGGDDDSDPSGEAAAGRALENFGESGLAEAEVVVTAYEEGRLGSQADLEADMEPFFNDPDKGLPPIPKPFGADGNFIPFAEMSDEQAGAFNIWSSRSDKVNEIVGLEKQEAVAHVVAKRRQGDDN